MVPAPSALAAVTKSACLTVMTEPRMTRVIWVQPRATRAKTTLQIVREVKAFRITRAPSSSGMPKKMSVTREMIVSIQPPK